MNVSNLATTLDTADKRKYVLQAMLTKPKSFDLNLFGRKLFCSKRIECLAIDFENWLVTDPKAVTQGIFTQHKSALKDWLISETPILYDYEDFKILHKLLVQRGFHIDALPSMQNMNKYFTSRLPSSKFA